jgi:copper(I)-binding protein
VSRRSTGPLRKILPAVAVGLLALSIAGCSAGQVTQTDTIEPAVNGNQGNVGDIALRDVVVSYPTSGHYREGDDAPLTLTIVNIGGTDDELREVSSPAAADVELTGKTALPARTGLQVVVPAQPVEETTTTEPSEPASESAPASGTSQTSAPATETSETSASPEETTPSPTQAAPDDIGAISIVLTGLTKDLPFGKNVPVTFVFAHAGQITLQLPIDTPQHARQGSAAE